MTTLRPGIYQHYSGKKYRLIGVGHHSETLEEMVVYQAQYESPDFGKNTIWVRPISLFLETVEREGKQTPRFTRIED